MTSSRTTDLPSQTRYPEYIFPGIPEVSTGWLVVLDYQRNDGRDCADSTLALREKSIALERVHLRHEAARDHGARTRHLFGGKRR